MFVPVKEVSIKQVSRKTQAVIGAEQIGLGIAYQVALDFCTGNQFKTKRLSAATECGAVKEFAKATRNCSDIKVAFVDGKLSDNTIFRVEGTTNVDAARLSFANDNIQVRIVLSKRNVRNAIDVLLKKILPGRRSNVWLNEVLRSRRETLLGEGTLSDRRGKAS